MKITIMHKEKEISFNIIYRKRKTLSLEIKQDGTINVLSPNGVDKNFIINAVKDKGDWILKKVEELEIKNKNKLERNYETGDIFMYLGKEYKLQVVVDKTVTRAEVKLKDENIIIKVNSNNKEYIQQNLKLWFADETLKIVKDRVNYYSKYFKDNVRAIKIKDQKTRWASCTYKNEILFNLRCSMAPIEIIDYVVVHEMCHMEHRNHSKDFYNAVGKIIPDYKEKIKWLKDNGMKMNI
ncbi:M48 family metallopeptidase [Paraclostridium bifermentans]|uniref:M48 family metallopeptidase n=1 Tax=Paraclostridium bifermentans TaxID=1490 RepID=UPI00359C6E7E